MCVCVIFSTFLGINLVISCIVDSLNLCGMPGLLLVGIVGRGGGAAESSEIYSYQEYAIRKRVRYSQAVI